MVNAMDKLEIKKNISLLNESIVNEIGQLLTSFKSEAVPNEQFIQSSLLSRLRSIPILSRPYRLSAGSRPELVSPVQSEIWWLDDKDGFTNARRIPDITIWEPHYTTFIPNQVRKLGDNEDYASYYSEGASIVFELKHIHKTASSEEGLAKQAFKKILTDISKIEKLHQIMLYRHNRRVGQSPDRPKPYLVAYFVIFSYVEKLPQYWNQLCARISESTEIPMSLHLGTLSCVQNYQHGFDPE